MKKITLLFTFLTAVSISGFATVWTIQNSGNTFSPNLVTINSGDTVRFLLGSPHDAREVSQTTWTANGNTALAGGFQTPFGGGFVLPAQLTVGTHYFVCTPHASVGMKGRIVVQSLPSGIAENELQTTFSMYPSPSNGKFQVRTDGMQLAKNYNVDVFDVLGKSVFRTTASHSTCDIDLRNAASGIYFVKVYDRNIFLTKRIIIE